MNKIIIVLLTLLLCFNIVYSIEQTSVGRIIGDDVNTILDNLDTNEIDLQHATYFGENYNTHYHNYYKNDYELRTRFNDNADSYINWEESDFETSKNNFETQELIIMEGEYDYYNNKRVKTPDIFSSEIYPDDLDVIDTFPLAIIDSSGAGDVENTKYTIPYNFAEKGTLIAPTLTTSKNLVRAMICNIGLHKNLGDTYKVSRNMYYKNTNPSPTYINTPEYLGLTLQSYQLYGNPLAEVKVPNPQLTKDCEEYFASLNEVDYQSQFVPQTDERSITDNIQFEYNIAQKEGYDYVNMSISKLPYIGNQVPILRYTKEYAPYVIIQNITGTFYNPQIETLNLAYKNEDDTLTNYECQNLTPQFEYQVFPNKNSQTLIVDIMPVKEENCQADEFKIYKELTLNIDKITKFPIFIKDIQTDNKVPLNKEFNLTISTDRYEDAYDELVLINNNHIITTINNITDEQTLNLFASQDLDNEFVLQYNEYYNESKENIRKTFNTSFRVNFVKLDIDYKPQVIKTQNANINIKLFNYLNESYNATFTAKLYNGSNIIEEFKQNITLNKGENPQILSLTGLSRYDEMYTLNTYLTVPQIESISKILHIYTNTKPQFVSNIDSIVEPTGIKYFELQRFDEDSDTLTENIYPFIRYNSTHVTLDTTGKSGIEEYEITLSDSYSTIKDHIQINYNSKPELFGFTFNNESNVIITVNDSYNNLSFESYDNDYDLLTPVLEIKNSSGNYEKVYVDKSINENIVFENVSIAKNSSLGLTIPKNEIVSLSLIIVKNNQTDSINDLYIQSGNTTLFNSTYPLYSYDTIELDSNKLRELQENLENVDLKFNWKGSDTFTIYKVTLKRIGNYEVDLPLYNKTSILDMRMKIQDKYYNSTYVYNTFTFIDENAYNLNANFNNLGNNLYEIVLQNTGKYDIVNGSFTFGNHTFTQINIDTYNDIIFVIEDNLNLENITAYFESAYINKTFIYDDFVMSNFTIEHTILDYNSQNFLVEYLIRNYELSSIDISLGNRLFSIDPNSDIVILEEYLYDSNNLTKTVIVSENGVGTNYTYSVPQIQNTINDSVLYSFTDLGDGVYEIIFNNTLNSSELVEFSLGSYSTSTMLNPDEVKVYIVEDISNANFEYSHSQMSSVLESYSSLGNNLYEVIITNVFNTSQVIEFYLGNYSHSSIFDAGERKVFIIEQNLSDTKIVYLNYEVE